MPFGYSNKLFPYPAVEYIPLNFTTLDSHSNSLPSHRRKEVRLTVVDNLTRANQLLSNYQLPPLRLKELAPTKLLIILLNSNIELINYRGYKVTLIGNQEENLAQVLQITAEYFYKDEIYFKLYTPQAEKLATSKYTLPHSNY
ncbi:MAG: hypothetical protein ACQEQI_01215 [Bacillota bacterium]